MPIIDPSTFFGYTDSLQAYLDGVKALGTEKVGGEDCDRIEVSIMKHQRSWYLWLSKRDHLPRKLKEIVRVSYDLIINEDWSAVTINADMPDTMFAWKPPEGLDGVERCRRWKTASSSRHERPRLRSGLGRRKADQAVGLPRQSRVVLRLEGWLTGLPRGDVSSPRTLREIQRQGPRGSRASTPRTTRRSPWRCSKRTAPRSPTSSTLPKPPRRSAFNSTSATAAAPCR